jgi:hypothetical protein
MERTAGRRTSLASRGWSEVEDAAGGFQAIVICGAEPGRARPALEVEEDDEEHPPRAKAARLATARVQRGVKSPTARA